MRIPVHILVVLALTAFAPPATAATRTTAPDPRQLWEAYPLRPGDPRPPVRLPSSSARVRPVTAATPAAGRDPSGTPSWLVITAIGMGALLLGAVAGRRLRRPAAPTAATASPAPPRPAPARPPPAAAPEPPPPAPAPAPLPAAALKPPPPAPAPRPPPPAQAARPPPPAQAARPPPPAQAARPPPPAPAARPPPPAQAARPPPPAQAARPPPPAQAARPPPPAPAPEPPPATPAPEPPPAAASAPEPATDPLPTRRFRRVPWPSWAEGLWRCEITRHLGLIHADFRPVAYEPGRHRGIELGRAGTHIRPGWGVESQDDDMREAVLRIADALQAAGWQPTRPGSDWYSARFFWPRPEDPPTTLGELIEAHDHDEGSRDA